MCRRSSSGRIPGSGYAFANKFGILSAAFNEMAETLETQARINDQAAQLAGVMLREVDARRFCREALRTLMAHTGSQIGAVYLLNKPKNDFEHFESIGLSAAVISLARVSAYEDTAVRLLEVVSGTIAARLNGVLAHRRIQQLAERLETQNRELDMPAELPPMESDEIRQACGKSGIASLKGVKSMKTIVTVALNPAIDKSSSVDHVVPERKLYCKRHLSEQEGPNMKEFDDQQDAPPLAEAAILKENRVHRILVGALLLVMAVEWFVLLIDQFWLSAFLVTLIIATLLSPVIFRKKFAITIGTLWEIFEFSMDRIFGFNMQKPMMGDPSGLTDTMWDMIVNAMGGFIISFMGWWYLKRKQTFFVRGWIRAFIGRNPRMFKKG